MRAAGSRWVVCVSWWQTGVPFPPARAGLPCCSPGAIDLPKEERGQVLLRRVGDARELHVALLDLTQLRAVVDAPQEHLGRRRGLAMMFVNDSLHPRNFERKGSIIGLLWVECMIVLYYFHYISRLKIAEMI